MLGTWIARVGVRIIALGAWMENTNHSYKTCLEQTQVIIGIGAMHELAAHEVQAHTPQVSLPSTPEGHC